MKARLDSTTVLTATCPPHRAKIDVYDTAITGYILEVRPNGSKTFAVRYRDEYGKQR